MTRRIIRMLPLAAALVVAPAAVEAQVAAPAPTPSDSAKAAEIRGWLAEIQQINGQLQALQERALQDPELGAAQEALGQRIRAAMEASDPTLATTLEQAESLQAEAVAAEQQGDQAKLQELSDRFREIESRFVQAQQQALAQPEISRDVEAFQTRLEARVVELDPNAPQLLARFAELQQQLAAALQAEG